MKLRRSLSPYFLSSERFGLSSTHIIWIVRTEQQSQDRAEESYIPELQGSCPCGASKYSVTGPPIQAIICQCRNCKKWSGGVFAANVWFPKQYFKLGDASAASIKTYADTNTNTDASKTLYRVSCGECGSSLYVDIPDYGVVSVTRGTLEEAEDIETLDPAVEFYCCSKVQWVAVNCKTYQRQKLA